MKEAEKPPFRRTIFFCCNERDPGEAACANRGARALQEKLKAWVKANGYKKEIRVMKSSCMDQCALGPTVCIQPDNVWYFGVTEEDLETIKEKWITSSS